MPQVLDVRDELSEILNRSIPVFEAAMNRLTRSILSEDSGKQRQAEEHVGDVITESMILADLVARKRLLLEADATEHRMKENPELDNIIFATSPVIPFAPFIEAINFLLGAEPRLAETVKEVRRVYMKRKHAFALARSASLAVTKRIKGVIAEGMREGRPGERTVKKILQSVTAKEKMAGFNKAYAQTAYKTTVATAHSAGRFQQVQHPAVRRIIPAFKLTGIVDDRERGHFPKDRANIKKENHFSARGLIAGVDDPIWDKFSPPLGYNCRHLLRKMDRFQLERMGLLRANGTVIRREPPGFKLARVAKGFGGRPDKKIYG